MNTHKAQT